MAALLAQARSVSVQASSPSPQVKAAVTQVGNRNWNWEKKSYVRLYGYLLSGFLAKLQCLTPIAGNGKG